MFVLASQLLDQKALEIFEALDQDCSESADYFQEKSGELPNEQLVSLRDKRIGNEGRTLLHNAARNGSLSAALSLLRKGHPVEPIDSSVSKVTPLMTAIKHSNIEVAIILLEAGASLLTQDVNGENALHYAARSGSFRMLKLLATSSTSSQQLNKDCASSFNVKRMFPEDLARNPRLAAILKHIRMNGQYANVKNVPRLERTPSQLSDLL